MQGNPRKDLSESYQKIWKRLLQVIKMRAHGIKYLGNGSKFQYSWVYKYFRPWQYIMCIQIYICPVGWGWRIHRLHLCKEVKKTPTSVLNMTLNDLIVPEMLELWGMWNDPSLPSLPGPLWYGVVAPDRGLSIGRIEVKCVLILNWIAWKKLFRYVNCVILLN